MFDTLFGIGDKFKIAGVCWRFFQTNRALQQLVSAKNANLRFISGVVALQATVDIPCRDFQAIDCDSFIGSCNTRPFCGTVCMDDTENRTAITIHEFRTQPLCKFSTWLCGFSSQVPPSFLRAQAKFHTELAEHLLQRQFVSAANVTGKEIIQVDAGQPGCH